MTFSASRVLPIVASGCVCLGLAAIWYVWKRREHSNFSIQGAKAFPARSEAGDRIPCNVFELEAWQSRLGTLTEMSLARCGLTQVPKEINQCKNLVKLDLAYNDLETLPLELADLPKLEILFILGARRMKKLPSVLSRLTSVTRLGLRSNGLEVLSGDLPPNLEHLILTDNYLIRIEESAYIKFDRLRKLMLANNRLTEFTGGKFPQKNLRNLELLRLANNNITSLSESILTLPKLSWLALAGNPMLRSSTTTAVSVERIHWSELDFGEKDQKLGSGASGTVVRATWRGKPVAVKKLQDRGSDGRATDEIHTIDTLFGKFFTKNEQSNDKDKLLPSSIVATRAVVLPTREKKEQEEDAKPKGKDDLQRIGLVMDILPNGVRDLAKPPTIIEVTRDRYPPAERFAPRLVAKILAEICLALDFLHQNHIMHGDVYAHNTLLHDASNTVKLGDLGAAFSYRAVESNQLKLLFQQIEVRAFGILVSELNARLAHRSKLQKPLSAMAAECLNTNVSKRPTFSDLLPRLDDLHQLVQRNDEYCLCDKK